MGIDQYNKWLMHNHKESFVPSVGHNVYDYIYLDMNHVFHNSMHKCRNEKEFFNRVKENLDHFFHNYLATKKIIMAIDGPSAYAKILLQRDRRLKSVGQFDINEINRLHITPGTQLLDSLEVYLDKYMKKLLKKYHFAEPQFMIVSSRLPNEGEIKMFSELINNGKENPDCKHLVVGNDADLIALALSVRPINHIYILGIDGILHMDHFIRLIVVLSDMI
jgi:5'-3' exonuclease